jgi:hypothetical protein
MDRGIGKLISDGRRVERRLVLEKQ